MRRVGIALSLLVTAVTFLACSDGGGPLPDGGSPDMIVADSTIGKGDLSAIGDASPAQTCAPSTQLIGRVDPARMLADIKSLVGLFERSSHTGQQAAAAYLRDQLSKLSGVTLKEQKYQYLGKEYVNFEATITGAVEPDRFILIGSHYDSTSKDPKIAPGADDDASGTAALLEAARALAGCRPARSVRLLFFSNEEKGIVGATAYVNALKAVLPPSKVIGYINVDMIGYGPADEDLDLATKPAQRAFADQMATAVEKWTSLKVKKRISDHCG